MRHIVTVRNLRVTQYYVDAETASDAQKQIEESDFADVDFPNEDVHADWAVDSVELA